MKNNLSNPNKTFSSKSNLNCGKLLNFRDEQNPSSSIISPHQIADVEGDEISSYYIEGGYDDLNSAIQSTKFKNLYNTEFDAKNCITQLPLMFPNNVHIKSQHFNNEKVKKKILIYE